MCVADKKNDTNQYVLAKTCLTKLIIAFAFNTNITRFKTQKVFFKRSVWNFLV